MKLKHWLIIVFCLIISIGSTYYFYNWESSVYKHEYVTTGNSIAGYEVFRDYSQSGIPASREIVVFANSDYKYTYTIAMSNDEHAVYVDGEFVPLSRFLITHYLISYEEIEKSEIGRRVYWSDENLID